MISAINHKALPFFDRVPVRAMAAVRQACERAESRDAAQHQRLALAYDLQQLGIEPPTLDEFRTWLEEVRLGRFSAAHYKADQITETVEEPYIADTRQRASIVKILERSIQSFGMPGVISVDNDGAFRLENARVIVRAAHSLFEAKLKGGYSPLSCKTEDTIVSEAIKELLEAEATATLMDADIHMTVGNKLADLLLQQDNSEIDAKIVDCLAFDMQQEICAALIAAGAA